MESYVAAYWPELQGLLKAERLTYWRLLAEFGGPAAVWRSRHQAAVFLRKVGRNTITNERIEAIIASAETTLGAKMLAAEERHACAIAREYLEAHEKKVKLSQIQQEKLEQFMGPELLNFTGPALAAALIAHNLDPLDYESPRQLLAAMGMSLKERSSGQKKGRPRLTKRGAPRVRQLLYMLVLRLIGIKKDEVLRAWYSARSERPATIAIVAIMRKVAKALWHLARGAPFDATKLFDTRKLGIHAQSTSAEAILGGECPQEPIAGS